MNTITIQTAQNIEVEYDVASLGDRIVGRIIDLLIQGAFVLIFMLIFFWGSFANDAGNEASILIFFIVILLPVMFYDLLMEQFFNGQSIGKKVMKIKVISLDGGQPTFSQYLLRWLFRLVDFSLTGSLGALISVAASENKQRIGDMVAGTTLIKTIPRTTRKNKNGAPC
ncbi:MAG: RDD family protein [Sphingobacteriales bacterium]|nr:RDD family protein [Sphingobacteriales bacterium]